MAGDGIHLRTHSAVCHIVCVPVLGLVSANARGILFHGLPLVCTLLCWVLARPMRGACCFTATVLLVVVYWVGHFRGRPRSIVETWRGRKELLLVVALLCGILIDFVWEYQWASDVVVAGGILFSRSELRFARREHSGGCR